MQDIDVTAIGTETLLNAHVQKNEPKNPAQHARYKYDNCKNPDFKCNFHQVCSSKAFEIIFQPYHPVIRQNNRSLDAIGSVMNVENVP
jgi:hypothetical protein